MDPVHLWCGRSWHQVRGEKALWIDRRQGEGVSSQGVSLGGTVNKVHKVEQICSKNSVKY